MSAPFDRVIVLDYESAWGRAVKLGFSCQTMEEYLRDPRFKAWGLSWKAAGTTDAPVWVPRKALPDFFASIDWSRTAVCAQNAAFDVSIMTWHYGASPAFIFDTLSMGRALHGVEAGNSLKALAERYGLPGKKEGLSPSENILDELPPDVEETLAEYCVHDTWLAAELLERMVPHFPTRELKLIDMTMRMYTEPKLVLDTQLLHAAVKEDNDKLQRALTLANVPESALASNEQFADVLRQLGVEPPTKVSKKTGKTAFAFAKNDARFQQLPNSPIEEVALVCDARLKVKSTQARTRAQRLFDIGTRGALPVPLSYYAALTGRWQAAKSSAINMQNMKRGSILRDAIMAPDGYELGVGDLSQIEPRVLAWFADYNDLLDIFRSGADPYAAFGERMFNLPGMTKDSNPVERQSAKSAMLGAGYQLGWASFAAQLLVGFLGAPPKRYTREEAIQLGVDGTFINRFLGWQANIAAMNDIAHTCTTMELLVHCLAAKKIIETYRATAQPIVDFWNLLGQFLEDCLHGGNVVDYKGMQFRKEEIELANGMVLRYPNLRCYANALGRREYVYGPDNTKLYPGKICNNVVQGTARIVLADGMLRVHKHFPVLMTVHDEMVALFPEGRGKELLPWMLRMMTKEPPYLRGIPLAADGGVHKRYGKAKA